MSVRREAPPSWIHTCFGGADTSDGMQQDVRIDHLSCSHVLSGLDSFNFIFFSQVKEKNALADPVVTLAKFFIAVEAEAEATAFLHLGLRKMLYLAAFDGDHGGSSPGRGSRERQGRPCEEATRRHPWWSRQ